MKERILKNEADFLAWKDDECVGGDDEVTLPDKYPCLASTEVASWVYQEERTVYKYREDIVAILAELDAEIDWLKATQPRPAPLLLTADEMEEICSSCLSPPGWSSHRLMRAIEAAVLKKNGVGGA